MHEVPGLENQREVGRRMADPRSSVHVLELRMLTAVVIGVVIAAVPAFGTYRMAIGAAVAGAEIFVARNAMGALSVGGRPTVVIALTDVILALAVVSVVPQSLALAAMVFCGATALNVFWYGPRVTLALAGLFGAGLILIGAVQRPSWWVATVVTYGVVAVSITTSLHTISSSTTSARRRHDALVNGIDAVVWEQDADGNTMFVSGNIARVLGTTADEFSRPGFYSGRVHPDDLGGLVETRHRTERGHPSEAHMRVLDDSGNYRRIHQRVRVALKVDGSFHSARGFVVDESERWAAEADLRRHTDFIRGIPVALTVLRLADRDDPRSLEIVSMNPAAEALFGATPLGSPLLMHITISDKWVDRLAAVAASTEPFERPFVAVPGSDGVFALRAVPLPDRHVGVSLEDVTTRARLAESFKYQAMHDQLTGLPNRAHFNSRLSEVLEPEDPSDAALLLVDLDQFKEINDAVGHEYGDRVLAEFAHRLAAKLRNYDLIARLGGDEFAILLTEGTTEDQALEIAGRVLELCRTRFEVGDAHFEVGASVGVALTSQSGHDAEALMRQADTAMYRAKARGGGAHLFSNGYEQHDDRRLELMGELREAIRSDAMEVHYQPRIDLADYRTVGLEALVRWRHPRYGLLPPADFIELAEVAGNICALTQYVGDRASQEIRGLLGDHDLSLSINLSTRTLYDVRLREWVEDLLAKNAFTAGELCFEIAETNLTDDPDRALVLLHELHDLGIRFSIDDFGTGHSSLPYLRELPIDEIKIDRRFVSTLCADDSIVRSVIDLGHNLGLSVVAEGVEDEITDRLLRSFGCDGAQGFRWGAPMPAVALAAHLSGAWENPVGVR